MNKYREFKNSEVLVHPNEVLKFIEENNVKVIDIRKSSEFDLGHLPNSVNITRGDLESNVRAGFNDMLEKENMEALFSRLGIANNDSLLISDAREGYDSARLWWILKVYGFGGKVYLVDGGYNGIKYFGIKLVKDVFKYEISDFKFIGDEDYSIYANLDNVLNRNHEIILDTRDESEFCGEELKIGASKRGRIKDAIWLNYTEAISSDHTIKNFLELTNIYEKYRNKSIIAYCQAGYRSAFTTFVLVELLGFENVRNYDGSWIEYSFFNETPKECDVYDLIVIGGGSGGLSAASKASRYNLKIALINSNSQLGGECLHSGCVPSKAILHGAKKKLDFNKAMDFVCNVQDKIKKLDSTERFEGLGCDVYTGYASFLDKNSICLDNGTILKGENIIISTGSLPSTFKINGIENVKVHTNETIFQMKELSKDMIVVGGGAIGCELGYAFSGFGTNVSIIEAQDEILSNVDSDAVKVARKRLSENIGIYSGFKIDNISKEGVAMAVNSLGETVEIKADTLLFAAGRYANTKKLNLDSVGIEHINGRIVINGFMQTNIDNIYAIGDVNGSMNFSHTADYEAEVAVKNIMKEEIAPVDYSKIPFIVFTSPQIYQIGKSENDLIKNGIEYKSESINFDEVDRFICEDESGFGKILYSTADGRILGASAACENAGEVMQLVGTLYNLGVSVEGIEGIITPYPSYSDGAKKLLRNAMREYRNCRQKN